MSLVSADGSLFEPGSAIRRVGGESALLFAGGRALLMQVAHPLIAAGVAEHSGFTRDPWGRLARTMQAVYGVIYGTPGDAARIGEAVRLSHTRVHGLLGESIGLYAAGTPYHAEDPELLLWVHATLVDTALEVHERFVGPVSRADRVAFHDDMRVVGEAFGVPPNVMPATYEDFTHYVRTTLASDVLAVGSDARAIAHALLEPPVPLPLRPTAIAVAQITIALLPERVAMLYGLRAGRRQRALAHASAAVARQVVPRAPRALRFVGPSGLALRALDVLAR
jgi:uncharacterized protein (DUF2236 family)